MRFVLFAALAALALALPAPARADVASASAGAFTLRREADVSKSPDEVWRALGQIGRWWNGEHTYSSNSNNLRIDLNAGGCFCERWPGGSVQHGQVIMAFEHEGVRTLRLYAALGPLQDMGVDAVWSFTITPRPGGAHVVMVYHVAGDPGLGLNNLAAPVDGVMMEQFGRLIRYIDTGAPT